MPTNGTTEPDRCPHRLPADDCAVCRRFGDQLPEPEQPPPEPDVADDQDDDPFDRDLAWWLR